MSEKVKEAEIRLRFICSHTHTHTRTHTITHTETHTNPIQKDESCRNTDL